MTTPVSARIGEIAARCEADSGDLVMVGTLREKQLLQAVQDRAYLLSLVAQHREACEQRDKDIGILLAAIEQLEEATDEDSDDGHMIAAIKRDWQQRAAAILGPSAVAVSGEK